MNVRILMCCVALSSAGCATPRQYLYNCTPFTVAVDGRPIASRTFEPSSAPADAKAAYPDGSIHSPLRVNSSQVDSFGLTNTWISPANVCRQFPSQVVLVDLR